MLVASTEAAFVEAGGAAALSLGAEVAGVVVALVGGLPVGAVEAGDGVRPL
jgi:hypothetical protein